MRRKNTLRLRCAKVALAAVVFRLFIPAGYMPASTETGWFLQLCPDGLLPAAMAVFHGAHQQHQDASLTQQETQQETQAAAAYDCPFAAFATDTTINVDCVDAADVARAVAIAMSPRRLVIASTRRWHRARAPPHTKVG
jgi:hypothetical protein